MLHFRITTPADQTQTITEILDADLGVAHLAVLPAVALKPPGDVILCDVVREAADDILDQLRDLDVDRDGSISIVNIDATLSETARRAEELAPGLGSDAVVWGEVEQKVSEETELSVTYLIFLTVATIIAGIGVLLDQPILIVGAMVVGPEFGPLAALCVGIVQRRIGMIRRSLVALGVGFPVAILATMASTWVLNSFGLISKSMLLADRPLTDFIWSPDTLSWIVAFLAGVAGMLSLTSAKSGALIGVLISVTTVPAAGNIAVALTYGVTSEAAGSAIQLLLNLTAIVTAGVLTLFIERLWRLRQHKHAAVKHTEL